MTVWRTAISEEESESGEDSVDLISRELRFARSAAIHLSCV